MKDVMEVVQDWVNDGEPVALATVVDTKKSAPQPPGTKMAINDAGRMAGAVSGGCVEGQVVQVAEGILKGDAPQLLNYGIADEDAWDVGLPCGGEISIWVETYDDHGLQGRFRELGLRGGRGALTTVLEGPDNVGAKLLLLEDGTEEGTLGDAELDSAALATARRVDALRGRCGAPTAVDDLWGSRLRRSPGRRREARRVACLRGRSAEAICDPGSLP